MATDDPWASDSTRAAVAEASKMDADLEGVEDRFDDYVNHLTGIGDYLQDKTFGGRRGGLDFVVRFLSVTDAENRWRGSDLGGRIVETIPDEMTREGFELTIQPAESKTQDTETEPEVEENPLFEGQYEPRKPKAEEGEKPANGKAKLFDAFPPGGGKGANPLAGLLAPQKAEPGPVPDFGDDASLETAEEVQGICEELGAMEAFWTALCYERAFGGAAILIGAEDGMSKLTKPLDEENITKINWLNVFQGGREGEIIAWSYYNDPRSPKYGLPETYMIRNIGTPTYKIPSPDDVVPAVSVDYPQVFWVHESRLLIFPGTSPSRRARVQSRGWGDSIFTRIDEVLSQYSQTWGGIANLMSSYHQDVLKMSGMAVKMAGGDKASKGNPLKNRARLIQQTRSIARMMVIDADEEFQRMTASISGAAELVQQFALRLAAAADMPVDLLMGQTQAGGLNKGDTTLRFFYDRIAARQKRKLLPQLRRLIQLIFLSKEGPTKGEEPERWDVTFRSLFQMTDLETADLRKKVAETDKTYIDAGVYSAEECAGSRFGGSEYSMETTLDLAGRQKMAAQNQADKKAQQKAQASIMGEASKAGVDPGQLNLEHPEHPNNATPPEPKE